MCPSNFGSLFLRSCFKNNSNFFITRGGLLIFFYCSEINIAGNNELSIRKEDIAKWTNRFAENVTSQKTLRI